ncbi:MAG: ABC transporter substrate-binding protein [Clostridia bacterium]|nr:ABC transporter substrate-binding protein [Clostridia bacterium]
MKRKAAAAFAALMLLFSLLLPLSGCGEDDEVDNTPDYPVEVGGVRFVGPPSKVVCYSSTLIGIIYAMGYQDQMFGRTANCDYKEAEELKACGTPDNPSVDLLVGNKVDLVITDDTMSQKSVDSIQEKEIPVVVIPRATGRSSMVEMYGALGAVFKGGNKGYNKGCQIANDIFSQLDDISRLVEDEETWNTCVILSSDLSTFATGDTLVSAILELVGGFNVAKDSMKGEYVLSDLMRSDPDVIIAPPGVEMRLRAKSSLVGIPALDNFRVYSMDMSVFDDQYQGVIKGAWRMAKILHPEVITDDIIPEGMIEQEEEEGVFID